NKLWIFGGGIIANGNFAPTSNVFYVDLTKKFDVDKVAFVDLTLQEESPFVCAWCLSAVGGKDNLTVFFFAGLMLDPASLKATTSTSYSFDIKTRKWSVATFTGSPSKRRELQPATDANGKIYMFGGGADLALDVNPPEVYDDMYILNSLTLEGTTGSRLNRPFPRIDYTATMLPDGIIVYIGGSEANSDLNFVNVDINKIQKYDTKSNTWSQTLATGEKTNNRAGHSAALAKNGQIIVFGGIYLPALLASSPQVMILDTSTPDYKWIKPPIMTGTGTGTEQPPDLLFHTATIVEKYMIIAFGNRTLNDNEKGQSGRLYLLDLEKMEWIKTYNPPSDLTKPSVNDTSETNKKSTNKVMIISIVVAVVLICLGTASIGIFYYKKRQLNPQNSNGTPTFASQPPPNVMNQQMRQYQALPTPNNHLQQPQLPRQPLPRNSLSATYNQHHNENLPSADYNNNAVQSQRGFDVPPDQPYGVVIYNTESGEMYVPQNMSTSSFPNPNSNNYMK
ncbi:4803_t:CDS:2, partial [Funneliformis mosseae]